MPVVQQTAACAGFRPVAKALGEGSSLMYTRGLGMPAAAASSATIWCSSGACSGETSTPWAARTAMVSLFQYERPFMARAMTAATIRPVR